MMPGAADLAGRLAPAVAAAAREAGALAARSFRASTRTSARIWSKAGGSPVTEADMAVDAFLKERLGALLPEAGWLSEETADDESRLTRRLVWIVDPIDGTRAFLTGHPDWSVVVALLADDVPVLGIVHAPALHVMYEAVHGGGARRDGIPIAVSARDELAGARVSGPKPLVDMLERRAGEPFERLPKVPSLALRLARVAEGAIDLGLVSSDARDWDIAAAHLVLREAGGRLTSLEGIVPAYNRAEPLHGELCAAPPCLHAAALAALSGAPVSPVP